MSARVQPWPQLQCRVKHKPKRHSRSGACAFGFGVGVGLGLGVGFGVGVGLGAVSQPIRSFEPKRDDHEEKTTTDGLGWTRMQREKGQGNPCESGVSVVRPPDC